MTAVNASDRHPSTQQVTQWFDWEHLPAGLPRDTSKACAFLAADIISELPDGPEGGQEADGGHPAYSGEMFYSWRDAEYEIGDPNQSFEMSDMEGAYAAGFNAALPRVLAEAARYKAERDDHRGRAAEWQKRAARLEADRDHLALELAHAGEELDKLRALAAEILASYERHTTYYASKPHQGTYAQWRHRAGLVEP